MKTIKNILVAVDFSEHSNNVLNNAISVAKRFDSKITLIHVLPDSITHEKVYALVEPGAREQLGKLRDELTAQGIATEEPILSFGSYSDRIVEESDNLDVNLLIIGAGEKSKDEAFQLGTTAVRIIKLSKKPVFVVKGTQSLEIKNIICPVDFSSESSRALRSAIVLAELFDAKLDIVTVCPIFKSTYTLRRNAGFFNDYRQKDHEKEFVSFLANFDLKGVKHTTSLLLGEPADEISAAIRKNKSDLLLMGTTGKSGINRILMGSVTEKVVRQVLCSFITFKAEDAISGV